MKNLLDSIRNMYQPQSEATMMRDDGKMVHNCAKHVEHAEYGQGQCISEEHADPDANGNIAWYDVMFEHGVVRAVPTADLKILQSESHMHTGKKAKKMAEAAPGGSNAAIVGDPHQAIKKKAMDDALAAANRTATGPGAQDKIVKQGVTKEDIDFDTEFAELNLTEEEIDEIAEAYMGMKKLTGALKSKGAKNPAGLAAWIGRKKYGKEKFQKAAAAGKKLGEDVKLEEVEQIDELSYDTLRSYTDKAKKENLPGKGGNRGVALLTPGTRDKGVHRAVDRMKKMKANEDVDQTVYHHSAIEIDLQLSEADKNYDAYFRAMMKKHGINHPGELDTPEKKKAFFNKVDAGFKAKNEEVFLEAWMSSALQDVMAAHKKAGNKISDEKSTTKDGKPHHSFVVTTPEGKRTRHVYHGATKKLETMSPAARSKESREVGDDEDDK